MSDIPILYGLRRVSEAAKEYVDKKQEQTKSPIERVYLDWGDNYISSYAKMESNAKIISTLDIYGCSGVENKSDNSVMVGTLLRAKEINPKLRVVRYVDAGTAKTKAQMYRDIGYCEHFVGQTSDLQDENGFPLKTGGWKFDGIFFDQFDDLNNCGEGKEYIDSIHRQNDLIDYAHEKGFFVIGNAWDFMSHVSCAVNSWNAEGIASTMGENDYWLIESCTFYPEDATSNANYGYGVWAGAASIDKLYTYYSNYYGKTCRANAIDFSSSGAKHSYEEKEYQLTWLLFSTLTRRGRSVCFDRGTLIMYDTNSLLSAYYYERADECIFEKASPGNYAITVNGHTIQTYMDSGYGGKADKASFDFVHVVVDGVEVKNFFAKAGSAIIGINKTFSEFNERINALDISNKENAPSFMRLFIDDWIPQNTIDAYENLHVKDSAFSYVNGIEITEMKDDGHSYTGHNSTWTAWGNSYWAIPIDGDITGHALELGCSNFTSDNATVKLSVYSNSSESSSDITITSSNESKIGNNSGFCVQYEVPRNTTTLYIRIQCYGGNYGTDVKWAIDGLYLVDCDSVPELKGKPWYTNLFPNPTLNTLGALSTTKELDSANRPFYSMTGTVSAVWGRWQSIFSAENAAKYRGHTLELGCTVFSADPAVTTSNLRFLLGGDYQASGFSMNTAPVKSVFEDGREVLRVQYKVPDDATQFEVSLYAFNAPKSSFEIHGLYLYDLDEKDLIIRGKEPSTTWLQICRVTDKVQEEKPYLNPNTLYITDSGVLFITDFNKQAHSLAGAIYKGAKGAGYTGTPEEFGAAIVQKLLT